MKFLFGLPWKSPPALATGLLAAGCAAGLFLSSASAQGPRAPLDEPEAVIGDSALDANDEGVEFLARGPVHEAFAEPYQQDAVGGVVIDRQPPDLIDELPPQTRPTGADIEWIGGYWAWDDERNDFLWVSGIFRKIPRGMRWVPGYWGTADSGFQWISGFWVKASTEDLAYLPPPPESLEEGPSSAPPSENQFWIPGCWNYVDGDYRWRAGYWGTAQPGWVWVPARYTWTPHGVVFVNGYWDYAFDNRGLLFAPIWVPQARIAHYRYVPRVIIDVGPLAMHMFVRPSYGHYYFGDFYGSNYNRGGYYHWSTFATGRRYDPLLAYYRWDSRRNGNDDFMDRLNRSERYFSENEDRRPPRTFRAQAEFAARNRDRNDRDRDDIPDAIFARRLDDFSKNNRGSWRFSQIDREQQRELRERAGIGDLRERRRELEVGTRNAEGEEERGAVRRKALRLPPPVTTGRPDARPDNDRPDRDRPDRTGPRDERDAIPRDVDRPDRTPRDDDGRRDPRDANPRNNRPRPDVEPRRTPNDANLPTPDPTDSNPTVPDRDDPGVAPSRDERPPVTRPRTRGTPPPVRPLEDQIRRPTRTPNGPAPGVPDNRLRNPPRTATPPNRPLEDQIRRPTRTPNGPAPGIPDNRLRSPRSSRPPVSAGPASPADGATGVAPSQPRLRVPPRAAPRVRENPPRTPVPNVRPRERRQENPIVPPTNNT